MGCPARARTRGSDTGCAVCARPELLHEARGIALSEERRPTGDAPHPLRDATFVAGPWEVLLEDESWARFDLARNELCAVVEQWLTPTGDNRSPWARLPPP